MRDCSIVDSGEGFDDALAPFWINFNDLASVFLEVVENDPPWQQVY
jgi:hypothetical protein